MQDEETPDEAGGFRDDAPWTPLHPDQVKVLRLRFAIVGLIPVIAAAALEVGGLMRDMGAPQGLVPGVVALIAAVAVLWMPGRRYRAWGYRESADELFVRHGLFKRVTTVIPFGRVQHIDIAQGPIERGYGLATLILHTAGTRSAAVPLPGLAHETAEAMRARIRAQIRQDLV